MRVGNHPLFPFSILFLRGPLLWGRGKRELPNKNKSLGRKKPLCSCPQVMIHGQTLSGRRKTPRRWEKTMRRTVAVVGSGWKRVLRTELGVTSLWRWMISSSPITIPVIRFQSPFTPRRGGRRRRVSV